MRESLQKIEGKLSARLEPVYAVCGVRSFWCWCCAHVSRLPSVKQANGRACTLRLL